MTGVESVVRPDVLVAVPAHLGSRRLPRKVLAEIGGVPMLRRVLDRCALARDIRAVVLCTDAPELADLAAQWGHEVLLREESCVSGTERLARALPTLLERYGGSGGIDQPWVVNVQADQPFLDPGLLDRLCSVLRELPSETSLLTPVFRLRPHQIHDPAVVKALLTADRRRAIVFSRSALPHVHDVDPSLWHQVTPYWGHIGVYVFRASALSQWLSLPESPLERVEGLEQWRWIEAGFSIATLVEDGDSLAVDTPAQLEAARQRCAA
jgi:3-deoxy-manno-octulosonate cytidylyltransferase (CMP-KDO synthetase)